MTTSTAGGAQGPVRVLIVDDEQELRETLAKVLGRRGMEAETAATGEQALALLGQGGHQVVVLDLRMPGLDGLQTLRRIHRMLPRTRVIILTGHGTAAAGLEAVRQEAFDFVLKPISTDQLVALIQAAAAAHAADTLA